MDLEMVEKSQFFFCFPSCRLCDQPHILTLTSAEGSSLGKPHKNLKLDIVVCGQVKVCR